MDWCRRVCSPQLVRRLVETVCFDTSNCRKKRKNKRMKTWWEEEYPNDTLSQNGEGWKILKAIKTLNFGWRHQWKELDIKDWNKKKRRFHGQWLPWISCHAACSCSRKSILNFFFTVAIGSVFISLLIHQFFWENKYFS